MNETRELLERVGERFAFPQDALDRLERRRDRKRRNQRIAAGVVGIAVFVAAIWIVTSGVPGDRTQTPAGTGPALTGPAVWPDYPGRVGLVGLAPEGLEPSTPARGELVLSFFVGHTSGDPGRYHLDLYADGRLIRQKLGEGYAGIDDRPSTGNVEQRLTPEGVELIRSEVLSTGLFDEDLHLGDVGGLPFGHIGVRDGDRLANLTWGDIGTGARPVTTPTTEQVNALLQLDRRLEDLSWLPASAWEDQEMRPFVPSRYSLCLETGETTRLDRALASLPRSAEDQLRAWDLTYSENTYSEGWYWCSVVTTERARALAELLDEAGVPHNGGDVWGVIYNSGPLNGSALNVSISFEPLLPHMP